MQHQLLNPSVTKDIPVMNAIICASIRIGQNETGKLYHEQQFVAPLLQAPPLLS